MEQGTGEEQHKRGQKEELSALSQTAILVPRYDCYGYSEVTWEKADLVGGKNNFKMVRWGDQWFKD